MKTRLIRAIDSIGEAFETFANGVINVLAWVLYGFATVLTVAASIVIPLIGLAAVVFVVAVAARTGWEAFH